VQVSRRAEIETKVGAYRAAEKTGA
jgi:hypothetical protein